MESSVVNVLRAFVAAELDDHSPAYAQIGQRLEKLIQDGSLPEGTTLPSERKLADMLGVSRITVQHSYNDLRQKKLITSHGRRGSIVARRITSPMNRLRGFTDEMTALGRVPTSRIVESRIATNRQIATILGLSSNAPLLYLRRIRYADGMPMSNESAWYNLTEAPMLADADLSQSVYNVLASHGLRLVRCDQVIEAVVPTEQDKTIFGFRTITPCILIKRTSYDVRGSVLEYVEGTFRGDVYSYRMTLDV